MKTRKTIKLTVLLIIVVLTVFKTNAYSQETQDLNNYNHNRLEIIADELDISENQAYEVLVNEQRVQSIRNLMIFITMFISLYTLKRSLSIEISEDKGYNNLYENYILAINDLQSRIRPDETFSSWDLRDFGSGVKPPEQLNSDKIQSPKKIIFIVISICVFIASFIYNSVNLSETFTGLFNPEYGALEQLKFLN